jgi:hypothetical protein
VLPGCLREFDELAIEFNTELNKWMNKAKTKAVVDKAEELAKSLDKDDAAKAKMYIQVLNPLPEIRSDFFTRYLSSYFRWLRCALCRLKENPNHYTMASEYIFNPKPSKNLSFSCTPSQESTTLNPHLSTQIMKKAMEKGTGYANSEIVRIQKLMLDKSVKVTHNPPKPQALGRESSRPQWGIEPR